MFFKPLFVVRPPGVNLSCSPLFGLEVDGSGLLI